MDPMGTKFQSLYPFRVKVVKRFAMKLLARAPKGSYTWGEISPINGPING